MKLLRILGLTAETDHGWVDLVAVKRVLSGERGITLREHEREFIYEQYGLTRAQLEHARRGRRYGDRHRRTDDET